MEFRKEKSEKSKEFIRKQFQSDILNIKTGYYKKEKILPITPKPNESRDKIKEFIPKYKEIRPNIRLFNDLLSQRQKHDLSFNELRPNLTRQNSEIQVLRGYTKIIRDNCFDEKGNFSARKRYRLEFYGKENINNKTFNKSFNNTIKDKRNKSFKRFFKSSLYMQKIPHNTKNVKSCKDIFKENKDIKNLLQTPRKISNSNLKDPQNENKKVKNDINLSKINTNKLNQLKSTSNQKSKRKLEEKLKYGHPKELNKEFYTKTNNPVKNNRIAKKDNDEKEYFNIEIENANIHYKEPLIDQKKLKQIFLKNGLHVYDFNEDGMNFLSKDKKIEAKLRKNKKDDNFDKNYRNVVRELNKINVKVNRCGIINEKGFINKNTQIKRKGTPGKNLCKNKENKDENTKLNTGLNIGLNNGFTVKRDKYILPQENKDYKNGYNYKMKYFNHNKK